MKKQVRIYIAVAVVAITAVLTSCEKDNEAQDPVILLKELYYEKHNSNSTKHVFEYDKKNRITKRSVYYTYYTNPILYYAHTITYKTNGDLEIIENGGSAPFTFVKSGNKISYTTIDTSYEIEVNDQGFPVKQTWLREGDNWENGSSTFTWENGNLTREDREYHGELEGEEYNYSETNTYTYDNYKSPFYNCTTPKWFLMYWLGTIYCGENNIETAKYSWHQHTYTSKNSYNADGFLASRTGDFSVIADGYVYTNSSEQTPK